MCTDDMFSVSHSLAAAIQDPTRVYVPAACAWCRAEYNQAIGVGVFCSTTCRDFEMTSGTGLMLRSAFQVEQARRKASDVMCTCEHREKAHGSHSGACLQMMGGRFEGSSDQRRCRCKQFTPKSETPPETPPDTLANDLLHSLVRAQGKKIIEQGQMIAKLQKNVDYLMGACKV